MIAIKLIALLVATIAFMTACSFLANWIRHRNDERPFESTWRDMTDGDPRDIEAVKKENATLADRWAAKAKKWNLRKRGKK